MSDKSIHVVCKMHRASRYFVVGNLIGVYNHRNVVMWYRQQHPGAGPTLVGETPTPDRDAELRRIS